MKKFKVSMICMCSYEDVIEVPDDATFQDAVVYAEEHLEDIPLGDLRYIENSDEIDAENCSFLDEENESRQ